MTLFIAFAVLWHEGAGPGWYIIATGLWFAHLSYHPERRHG